jgi:hypothetical protein
MSMGITKGLSVWPEMDLVSTLGQRHKGYTLLRNSFSSNGYLEGLMGSEELARGRVADDSRANAQRIEDHYRRLGVENYAEN